MKYKKKEYYLQSIGVCRTQLHTESKASTGEMHSNLCAAESRESFYKHAAAILRMQYAYAQGREP